MNKLWKALGIAALAAVVPVRFRRDEETGKKTYQSLLWKLDVGPTGNGEATEIGLDLMEGVLTGPILNAVTAKKEAQLFADDEPEAAVLEEPVLSPTVGETADNAGAQSATDGAADEADFDPEF